ncbi:hypothetical protein [Bacillus sp. 1P02SD]|uniref:hypothetical protein n=1 Tax=Bacillus sp. 1P02SD TaxID=3132264 RepID=UPI0039A27302
MSNWGEEVQKVQQVVHASEEGRIIVMDSITWTDERNNNGDVMVGASFAGIISVRFPLRVVPKAVICHDAGIGKNNAGINGLLLLEGKGIPGAAVETMSARLGDGKSMYEDGVISVVNDLAKEMGVYPGMTVKEAAHILLKYKKVIEEIPKYQEVMYESERGKIVAMETVTFTNESNHYDVVCAGSHSGVTSAAYSSRFSPRGVICNDGGMAKDNSGIAGLPILDSKGIAGAAVDTMSAEIGSGRSTYEDGIISARNETAKECGIEVGMTAKEAAMLMLEGVR